MVFNIFPNRGYKDSSTDLTASPFGSSGVRWLSVKIWLYFLTCPPPQIHNSCIGFVTSVEDNTPHGIHVQAAHILQNSWMASSVRPSERSVSQVSGFNLLPPPSWNVFLTRIAFFCLTGLTKPTGSYSPAMWARYLGSHLLFEKILLKSLLMLSCKVCLFSPWNPMPRALLSSSLIWFGRIQGFT